MISNIPIKERMISPLEDRVIDTMRDILRVMTDEITRGQSEQQSKIEIILSDRGDGVKRVTVHSQNTLYLQAKK